MTPIEELRQRVGEYCERNKGDGIRAVLDVLAKVPFPREACTAVSGALLPTVGTTTTSAEPSPLTLSSDAFLLSGLAVGEALRSPSIAQHCLRAVIHTQTDDTHTNPTDTQDISAIFLHNIPKIFIGLHFFDVFSASQKNGLSEYKSFRFEEDIEKKPDFFVKLNEQRVRQFFPDFVFDGERGVVGLRGTAALKRFIFMYRATAWGDIVWQEGCDGYPPVVVSSREHLLLEVDVFATIKNLIFKSPLNSSIPATFDDIISVLSPSFLSTPVVVQLFLEEGFHNIAREVSVGLVASFLCVNSGFESRYVKRNDGRDSSRRKKLLYLLQTAVEGESGAHPVRVFADFSLYYSAAAGTMVSSSCLDATHDLVPLRESMPHLFSIVDTLRNSAEKCTLRAIEADLLSIFRYATSILKGGSHAEFKKNVEEYPKLLYEVYKGRGIVGYKELEGVHQICVNHSYVAKDVVQHLRPGGWDVTVEMLCGEDVVAAVFAGFAVYCRIKVISTDESTKCLAAIGIEAAPRESWVSRKKRRLNDDEDSFECMEDLDPMSGMLEKGKKEKKKKKKKKEKKEKKRRRISTSSDGSVVEKARVVEGWDVKEDGVGVFVSTFDLPLFAMNRAVVGGEK